MSLQTGDWTKLEKASIVIGIISGLLGIYFYVRGVQKLRDDLAKMNGGG